jgi:hypothetical protein
MFDRDRKLPEGVAQAIRGAVLLRRVLLMELELDLWLCAPLVDHIILFEERVADCVSSVLRSKRASIAQPVFPSI